MRKLPIGLAVLALIAVGVPLLLVLQRHRPDTTPSTQPSQRPVQTQTQSQLRGRRFGGSAEIEGFLQRSTHGPDATGDGRAAWTITSPHNPSHPVPISFADGLLEKAVAEFHDRHFKANLLRERPLWIKVRAVDGPDEGDRRPVVKEAYSVEGPESQRLFEGYLGSLANGTLTLRVPVPEGSAHAAQTYRLIVKSLRYTANLKRELEKPDIARRMVTVEARVQTDLASETKSLLVDFVQLPSCLP